MLQIKDIPEDGIIFYDIETDSQYCQYCRIRLISYQLGLNSEPVIVTDSNRKAFKRMLADPSMYKVSFNGINFDDVVLAREGFPVNPGNRHDMYLALKTVAPTAPSFGLKGANFHYFTDWHEPERLLHNWCKENEKDMWEAPDRLLMEYCRWDVKQTVNLFLLLWEVVQREEHWDVYNSLELAMGQPLHEMMLLGGEWICPDKIEPMIENLQKELDNRNGRADFLTEGVIRNVLSNKQVNGWYDVEHTRTSDLLNRMYATNIDTNVERLDLQSKIKSHSTKGELDRAQIEAIISKMEKEEIKDPVAHCVHEGRDIAKTMGYYKSYLRAARYEQENKRYRTGNFFVRREESDIVSTPNELVKIPKSYSLSGARTRRFISGSRFGINFQNQHKRSKAVQIVPPGWLAVFIDSTQIENVVHIWASKDKDRREDYTKNEKWNEYVWLCNQVLGGDRDKEKLEAIKSPVNPSWSIYKQFKTAKLALNFGMGPKKFAKMSGISTEEAEHVFNQIHRACPAIHRLQDTVKRQILTNGRVRDPFGHIYSGSIRQAYKVVSYLIQGCGTGSVPKAMTVACYETLHSMDDRYPNCTPYLRNPLRRVDQYAVLCGTTHDELSFRISLGLPTDVIVWAIKECMTNMEEKFSDRFGMPLRAKLALSITTAAEQVELNHHAPDFESKLVDEYIEKGRKLCNDTKTLCSKGTSNKRNGNSVSLSASNRS